MNVRSYVYHPVLNDTTEITALIVWDRLSNFEAGGIVEHYNVVIRAENGDVILVSVNLLTCFFDMQSKQFFDPLFHG